MLQLFLPFVYCFSNRNNVLEESPEKLDHRENLSQGFIHYTSACISNEKFSKIMKNAGKKLGSLIKNDTRITGSKDFADKENQITEQIKEAFSKFLPCNYNTYLKEYSPQKHKFMKYVEYYMLDLTLGSAVQTGKEIIVKRIQYSKIRQMTKKDMLSCFLSGVKPSLKKIVSRKYQQSLSRQPDFWMKEMGIENFKDEKVEQRLPHLCIVWNNRLKEKLNDYGKPAAFGLKDGKDRNLKTEVLSRPLGKAKKGYDTLKKRLSWDARDCPAVLN